MDNIIKLFEANSKKAMSESEAATSQRNWVKAERKETESETWQEAARILKNEQSRQADVSGSLPPESVSFAKWLRDNTIADGAPKLHFLNYKKINPEKSRYTIEELYEVFRRQ